MLFAVGVGHDRHQDQPRQRREGQGRQDRQGRDLSQRIAGHCREEVEETTPGKAVRLMDCASVEPGDLHGKEEKRREVLTRGRLSHKDSRRIPDHEWAQTFVKHAVDEFKEQPHLRCIQF